MKCEKIRKMLKEFFKDLTDSTPFMHREFSYNLTPEQVRYFQNKLEKYKLAHGLNDD